MYCLVHLECQFCETVLLTDLESLILLSLIFVCRANLLLGVDRLIEVSFVEVASLMLVHFSMWLLGSALDKIYVVMCRCCRNVDLRRMCNSLQEVVLSHVEWGDAFLHSCKSRQALFSLSAGTSS